MNNKKKVLIAFIIMVLLIGGWRANSDKIFMNHIFKNLEQGKYEILNHNDEALEQIKGIYEQASYDGFSKPIYMPRKESGRYYVLLIFNKYSSESDNYGELMESYHKELNINIDYTLLIIPRIKEITVVGELEN